MYPRVGREALTYLESHLRPESHMAASPLILTLGIFEVLKVPTWLEPSENKTKQTIQTESHSPKLY